MSKWMMEFSFWQILFPSKQKHIIAKKTETDLIHQSIQYTINLKNSQEMRSDWRISSEIRWNDSILCNRPKKQLQRNWMWFVIAIAVYCTTNKLTQAQKTSYILNLWHSIFFIRIFFSTLCRNDIKSIL